MRILLVKPKARLTTILGLERLQRLEPLEFGYLAAAIPSSHDVRVLDLRLERKEDRALVRTLRRFQPDLVGFTAYSHESPQMKQLASLVRRHCPRAKTVVGGHHATVAPGDCNVPQLDFIIRGEGCVPFAALVAALDEGRLPKASERLLLTGDRFDAAAAAIWPQYPDPATIPIPRRDLWNPRHYYSVWVRENARHWDVLFPPVAMVRTSYGCRMKCTFCVVPFLCGGVHRPRPVDAVVEDLARLTQEYVYFADDENFLDEKHASELAEAISRRGLKKKYFAWARATTVVRSPELFRQWREIGLDGAFLGFEFPTDEQLRQVRKGSTVAVNHQAHDILRGMGIACHIGFMLRPEDGEDDFQRLRDFISAMPPAQFSFTVCTPSPGSEDYRAIESRMLVKDSYGMHDCMHPLVPTKLPLRRFAELYAHVWNEASRRNPLRQKNRLVRPLELWRVLRAEHRFNKALRTLDNDYPVVLRHREARPAAA